MQNSSLKIKLKTIYLPDIRTLKFYATHGKKKTFCQQVAAEFWFLIIIAVVNKCSATKTNFKYDTIDLIFVWVLKLLMKVSNFFFIYIYCLKIFFVFLYDVVSCSWWWFTIFVIFNNDILYALHNFRLNGSPSNCLSFHILIC